MLQTRTASVVLALFLIFAHRSDAIYPWRIRKLPRILADIEPAEGVSPAPSPSSVLGGTKGSGKEADPTGREGCLGSSEACHVKDLSACLLYAGSAPKEAFLVLQNSGEIPLNVNIVFLPANITSDKIQLAKKNITKVNLTAKVQGSSSIVLNAGNGDCVVQLKSSTAGGSFYKNFPYASQVSPIHGVYLFFAAVLVIGGVWACCKFGKKERHVDGVPYQELEMGRTEADSTLAVDIETADGWDESWDDDWGDEIREVKPPPSKKRVGNGSPNGHKSKSSNKDGWEDNWDD
ncbi:uncharacterized protein LOC116196768 [Punica granatum]|uniref:Uncharacterized protein n=2 Tax=Punica granatum TaxID=22663 RepID=A0A2I0I9C2_PUNGR|nr:uncharacterized protein LOC116196768 [Punica granatum]PKI40582.1 hypothetical protein CRG98_038992 [Punica granatum]